MIKQKGRPGGALVCTPNSSHVAVSKDLLKAGIHVLCEKLVSTTLSNG
jgi:predicted dehydrogenase